MKDYYYILGLKQTTTTEEVKKAYRKLSLKFHPDKNDGDEFFTERFKEIQEAYETLIDSSKRQTYDDLKTSGSTHRQNNSGTNFNPDIEYFKSNKQSFEFDEEVTFSWKTINANKVLLKPFGTVPPIGQKTYKIKDFKNSLLTFELVAENSNIGRQIKSSLTLSNKTYKDLYGHFKEQFRRAEQSNSNKDQNSSQNNKTTSNTNVEEDDFSFKAMIWFNVLLIAGIIIFVLTR
jgi:curved DNA-binding protein CbpA